MSATREYYGSVHARGRTSKGVRVLLWGVPLLVIAGILATLAVAGMSAWRAQQELRAAVPLIAQVQKRVGSGDFTAVAADAEAIALHTSAARDATDTWAWQAMEAVPYLGDTFHAVRGVATAADELASGAAAPLASIDIAGFLPSGGRIDLAAVEANSAAVADAGAAVSAASAAIHDIDITRVPSLVAEPVAQLRGLLGTVEPVLSRATALLPVVPDMLGANGPRSYLVLVQNNAEVRPLGGNPASMFVLTADQGAVSITAQATSQDFDNARPDPIIPLPESTVALFDTKVGRYIQDITGVPDFDLTTELATAYWAESFGTHLDGVASIDPVFLSYLLGATGPVPLETGDVLTSENATSLLLNEVYWRYPNPRDQDAFFSDATRTIFAKVTSGELDKGAMMGAIVRGVDERRVFFHPFDEAALAAFDGSRMRGELLPDNDEATQVGVFVYDLTEGKMNNFTNLAVTATKDVCPADTSGSRVTTMVTLGNDISAEDAAALPHYVHTERHWERGTIGTDVVLYGPVGARFVSAWFDGAEVEAFQTTDRGRPAVRFFMVNQPMQAHVFAAVFETDDTDLGPLDVWHTPMVRDVWVEKTENSCQ